MSIAGQLSTEESANLTALWQEIGRAADAANAAWEREDYETARMEEARHLRLRRAHKLATDALWGAYEAGIAQDGTLEIFREVRP